MKRMKRIQRGCHRLKKLQMKKMKISDQLQVRDLVEAKGAPGGVDQHLWTKNVTHYL